MIKIDTRIRRGICPVVVCAAVLAAANEARAEKVLAKGDDWEVFTDGRAGGFLSYVRGDGFPRAQGGLLHDADGAVVTMPDPADPTRQLPVTVVRWDIRGGGWDALAERSPNPNNPGQLTQGTVESMRVRTGFVGNTVGLGARSHAGNSTVTSYVQVWFFIENDNRQKNKISTPDFRQGYVKAEGRWGGLLLGKSRALFSRGATDINAMYGHRFGLGFPTNVDTNGIAAPTSGHIGFGVLGSGFAAGLVYVTPNVGGLQLSIGAFDPVTLSAGAYQRTKWPRPEAELTFERTFGTNGKIVLFGNGAYQKLYRADFSDNTFTAGFGYGGRFELGPFRLGAAGHYGRGLGLYYALEQSDAAQDLAGNQRTFDGYYVQSQVALGRVDVSAGWGITRVFLIDSDNAFVTDPSYPTFINDPAHPQIHPHSEIKYQMGISAGVVFHVTPALHIDVDAFRAKAAWFLGEQQVVYAFNSGMTYTW